MGPRETIMSYANSIPCAYTRSEFCGQDNTRVELTADAVPEGAVADYLLEPAEVPKKKEAGPEAGPDNEKAEKEKVKHQSTLVIFAVDVSGSMSSTTEVPALQGKGEGSHCNHWAWPG